MRYRGASSGSLVAAVLAMDADVVALFGRSVDLLDGINTRRLGWIGAYSATIGEIVRMAAEGKNLKTAAGRLRIGTTVFTPLPTAHEIVTFGSAEALRQAVLASCYIPVVWESPTQRSFAKSTTNINFL